MDKLQEHMVAVFKKIAKKVPELRTISFNVGKIYDLKKLYGFLHFGEDCEPFNSMIELERLIEKNTQRKEVKDGEYRRKPESNI